MKLSLKVGGLRDIKITSSMVKNKRTEEIELVTSVRFDAAIKPEDVVTLMQLMEIEAAVDCEFVCNQAVMELNPDTGKREAVLMDE